MKGKENIYDMYQKRRFSLPAFEKIQHGFLG